MMELDHEKVQYLDRLSDDEREAQEDFDEWMDGQLELNWWSQVAQIAKHDSLPGHNAQLCQGDDVSTYPKLNETEHAIVLELWRKFGKATDTARATG